MARLFGFVDDWWRSVPHGPSLTPSVSPRFDEDVADARNALGDAAFEAAFAEGKGMMLERAVAYALGDPQASE